MSSVGIDRSGNGNNWTSNNLTQYDVMEDSPTNNFAVYDSLQTRATYGMPTLTEGNLKFTSAGVSSSWGYRASNIEMTSGKWYAEFLCSGNNSAMIGVMNTGYYGESSYLDQNPQDNAGSFVMYMDGATYTGFKYNGGSHQDDSIAQWNDDDIVGIAIDADAGTAKFFVNGSLQEGITTGGTVDISAGSGDGYRFWALMPNGNPTVFTANFGQDSSFAGAKTPQGHQDGNDIADFFYAPPSGYLALCAKNLPEIDVIASENFNTVLYTGNGADNHAITGVGFQPDFVWMKSRNAARSHALVDSVRGRGSILFSDDSGVQQAPAAANNDLVSFDTDGFTVGTPERAGSTNENNDTIVAWNWKAGGSASSNSNGSITSSVSANVAAGFSIATFTLPGTVQTIGHGLSKPPELFINKGRATGSAWWTFVKPVGNTSAVRFDGTNAAGASTNFFNNTDPTSTVVTIGANTGSNNLWLMYSFHSVDGYSKVGSYIGNGLSSGPFVYCGFKPAMIIQKRTDSADSWHILDNKRSPFNVVDDRLYPNATTAESTSGDRVDFISNGFKVRATNGDFNAAGGTYIFYAIAEIDFKNSTAR